MTLAESDSPHPALIEFNRVGALRVYRRREVPLELILGALRAQGDLLKASHKSVTRRVGNWVLKTGVGAWKRTLFRARYRQGWTAALHLERHAIGAPKPIAFIETARCGVITQSTLICEYLDESCDVEAYADRLIARAVSPDEIHAYLARIAPAVNRLIESGAYHTDLAGKNILTRDGRSFYFIDLDGVVIGPPYTRAMRLKSHVQLYDSFCDRWDDQILEPFLAHMLPQTEDRPAWMAQVRALQALRRARTITARAKHHRP